MDELFRVLAHGVYALNIGVNVGVIDMGEGKAVLIDTGLSRDAAKKIIKALATINLTPAAIFNTHAHADHFGGNAHIVDKFGAQVYCPPDEAATLKMPMLEPIGLYAGAAPIKDLTGHFLLAPASRVDVVVNEGEYTIGARTLRAVALPGHTLQHFGYITDSVLFAGDLVLSPEVLAKHGVPFCFNVGQTLASLDKMEALVTSGAVSVCLPCHAPPTRDPLPLIAANRAKMQQIAEVVADAVRTADGLTTADVLTATADALGMTVTNATQYYLMHLTLHAYLAYLLAQCVVTYSFAHNRMLWRAA